MKKLDKSTAWVKNSKGMVSAAPRHLVDYFVGTRPGWKYAEAEKVSDVKQYPADMELTELGEKRRKRAAEIAIEKTEQKAEEKEKMDAIEAETGDLTYKELQALAKDKGVPNYWSKKSETLKEELGML
jgi:hypothetical protein